MTANVVVLGQAVSAYCGDPPNKFDPSRLGSLNVTGNRHRSIGHWWLPGNVPW